jgi:peptidoglycan/xylan/chitin deacetylase (PgdA/CDA1 family)
MAVTARDRGDRRWRPSPLLAASAAWHLGALCLTVARPRWWPWALGGIAANHLWLTAAGLWPRSQVLGPNWVRLPDAPSNRRAVAITIDDGPDPQVTPRVLELLARAGARATFFCVGTRALAQPDLTAEIVRQGHAVENHSQHHAHHFSLLGPAALRAEIGRAQECFEALTGERPRFFRAPAGLRNPFLEPVLCGLQLRLASWTRRGFDTVATNPDLVLRRLQTGLQGRDILLLHDGHAARTAAGVPVVLEVLPRLLDACAAAGLATITLRAAEA